MKPCQEADTLGSPDSEGSQDLTIMAISWSHNLLSCALYSNGVLSLLSEQYCDSHQVSDMIVSLRMSRNPYLILLSSRSDQIVVNACEMEREILDHSVIKTLLVIDFNEKNGLSCLHKLELEMPDYPSVGCAGAILAYLTTTGETVTKILKFSLDDWLHVDQESLFALSVFNPTSHPNMQSKEKKESTSLFDLLNRTKTPMGSEKLKSWFLSPLCHVRLIEQRQIVISYFVEPSKQDIMKQFQKLFGSIGNIPQLVKRLRVKSVPTDWKKMANFLALTQSILAIASGIDIENEIFYNLSNLRLDELFQDLLKMINAYVDFDQSFKEMRMIVLPLVDTELDEMKRVYCGLDHFLTLVAQQIDIPTALNTFSILYFPHIGFFVQISADEGIMRTDGLEFMFSAEAFNYYKSPAMQDLDAEIGDIHSMIVNRELEIMHTVTDTILASTDTLLYVSNLIAELDSAITCCRFKRFRPTSAYNRGLFTSRGHEVIERSNFRHPILENLKEQFVTNSFEMGTTNGFLRAPKSKLISGPNGSGKTVYLQQVALIVYMAQIGSFVPCSSAVIGTTDKILTRLRTHSTISKDQSTFCIDLKQALSCVSNATSKSLVLLDEFGKGTSPEDGVGIFAAVLEDLCKRDCRLLTATHFYEIFNLQSLNSLPLDFFTFSVLNDRNETVFLYQLVRGKCNSSLGIECAKKAGVKESVVSRATEIAAALNEGAPIPSLQSNEEQFEKSKNAIDLFLSLDLAVDDIDMGLRALVGLL